MVFQPGAQEAAEWARTHPAMSVGIHIDLCEWVYVNESWELLYERCNVDDAAAVATEVVRQLSHFRHLTGHIPTHVDCHQHVHRSEPAGAVIRAEAAALGVPLRDHSAATYVGNFYGQMNTGEALPDLVSADALVGLIRDLPEGWSELACHAGYAEDTTSVYRDERRLEVEALCDPKVRAALADEGVELRAFRDLVQR
jgi:predicted glycoside hydrolase/deacetylase ChbG (UPF0249 family)